MQRGNTVKQTLISEILEEIGVQKINTVLSNIRSPLKDNPLDVGLILMIFSCNIPENTKIQLSAEHTEYIWASSSEA